MGTPGSGFETISDLLAWCSRAPEGTSLDARVLARVLARILEDLADPNPVPAPAAPQGIPGATTWREKLWTVPSETRLGVTELCEALGRPRSWIYARTGPKAEDPVPHRKLDGVLLFCAGELRAWIRDREDVQAAGPMDPPTRTLKAV